MPNSDIDIANAVAALAATAGVEGCALVEAETGMAWHHGGRLDGMEMLGEAAVEFWRLQRRLSEHFAVLGPARSAACGFDAHLITLYPCLRGGPDAHELVVVCVAQRHRVDWGVWSRGMQQLHAALGSTAAPEVALS